MTFLCQTLLYVSNVGVVVVVLKFVSLVDSQKLQGRGGREKMLLIVVEAVPVSSKLPATDDSMRISTGRRYED